MNRGISLKKFIRTAINQLPPYIKQYSSEEQKLLNEFLDVLQECESKPNIARSKLSEELAHYSQSIRQNVDYPKIAFLWFLSNYIENANLLLSVADFHAEKYYAYLVKHLRNNGDLKGVFQLIRKQVPLIDLRWELLQYACIVPPALSKNEYDILISISTLVEKEGFESLHQSRIRSCIRDEARSHLTRRLNWILNPLQATWYLWYLPQAFGINWFFFRIQLTGFRSFSQIFDYNDPMNTTLCRSNIYLEESSPDTYTGILYIPDHLQKIFIDFFRNLDASGNIILHEFVKIIDIKMSTSYALYEFNGGWRNIRTKEWSQIIHYFNNDNIEEQNLTTPSFHLSSPFNPKWDFRKHTNATRAIKIYLDLPRVFTFDKLPFGQNPVKISPYSKREKAHLKEMFNNSVVKVIFIANRLIEAFSIDTFFIKFSKIPLKNLTGLLSYLPSCIIYISESHIYLRGLLKEEIVSKIINYLDAEGHNVVLINNPRQRTTSNFDFDTLRWKTPFVLNSKKKKGKKFPV